MRGLSVTGGTVAERDYGQKCNGCLDLYIYTPMLVRVLAYLTYHYSNTRNADLAPRAEAWPYR